MAASAPQRYLAEFVGTFALLFVGGGSAVFSLLLLNNTVFGASGPVEQIARVVLVSLAFGLVVAGLAWALGDVSGGHFNPAVTVSMAISGRLAWRDVIPYVLAQLFGGLIGMAVVLAIVLGGPSGITSAASASSLASQCYSSSFAPSGCQYSLGAVFLLEVVLGFFFLLVIQLTTRAESSARNLAPLAIGSALLVGNLLAIPVDGASMNPVRSFAPALLSLYWSGNHWALTESWVFWVAPILGGALAAAALRLFKES